MNVHKTYFSLKNKHRNILFCLILLTCSISNGFAQSFKLKIQIEDLSNRNIVLGLVKGDGFKFIDSIYSEQGRIQFNLDKENQIGVYRLFLGQTKYAQVMNEPPQTLDFIFNKEDIFIKTDFNHPEDSIKIIQSDENKVWYEFKKQEKKITEELKMVGMELDYFQSQNDSLKSKHYAQYYNQLQFKRDSVINHFANLYPNLLAAKLISMDRESFMDGYLSKEERNRHFYERYFSEFELTDETLINSTAYTDAAFKYIMSYANRGLTREEQIVEFKKAANIILATTNKNEKVYEQVLDFLIRGFEKLRLNGVVEYLAENYSVEKCETDEKTTLQRRLYAQKMKPGTKVPDFTIEDINGDPIRLSEIIKENTLIIFWASWCPHCTEMLSQLKTWDKNNRDKNIEIITVSLDNDENNWKNAVFNLGMETWYNLSDLKQWDGKTAIEYNVYATPTLFLVNWNMEILLKPLTLAELDDFMNNI